MTLRGHMWPAGRMLSPPRYLLNSTFCINVLAHISELFLQSSITELLQALCKSIVVTPSFTSKYVTSFVDDPMFEMIDHFSNLGRIGVGIVIVVVTGILTSPSHCNSMPRIDKNTFSHDFTFFDDDTKKS